MRISGPLAAVISFIPCVVALPSSAAAPPPKKVIDVGVGFLFSCALDEDHHLRCWGDVQVPEAFREKRFERLVVGSAAVCGITPDALPECFTKRGATGALPGLPPADIRIKKLSMHIWHSCALTLDNHVECWARDAGHARKYGYTSLPSNLEADDVEVGWFTTCIVKDGKARCWGDDEQSMRAEREVFTGVKKLAVTLDRVCALKDDGSVACDEEGNVVVQPNLRATQIATGHDLSCAVDENERLRCWGGDGEAWARRLGEWKVAKISMHYTHQCALGVSGEVACWGDSRAGEVPDALLHRPPEPPAPQRVFQVNCNWGNPPNWVVLERVKRASERFEAVGRHSRLGDGEYVSEDLDAAGKREIVTFIDDRKVRMEWRAGDEGATLVLRKRSNHAVVGDVSAIELQNPGSMEHFGHYMTTDVVVHLKGTEQPLRFSSCYVTGARLPSDPALYSYKNLFSP